LDSLWFIKGLVIGFALAAPVGPIALLCIQRTVARGRPSGLISGLGAAAADALYGLVAAFSISMISSLLLEHRLVLKMLGGIVLIILGIRTFRSQPRERAVSPRWHGLFGDFLSSAALTLTNPMTFVAFAAVFASAGLAHVGDNRAPAGWIVLGVLIGSLLWWTALVLGTHAVRGHFDAPRLILLNRVAGVFIVIIGMVYLLVHRI
jgi:threonine/homoserine/homoserine lactone efflux protein